MRDLLDRNESEGSSRCNSITEQYVKNLSRQSAEGNRQTTEWTSKHEDARRAWQRMQISNPWHMNSIILMRRAQTLPTMLRHVPGGCTGEYGTERVARHTGFFRFQVDGHIFHPWHQTRSVAYGV